MFNNQRVALRCASDQNNNSTSTVVFSSDGTDCPQPMELADHPQEAEEDCPRSEEECSSTAAPFPGAASSVYASNGAKNNSANSVLHQLNGMLIGGPSSASLARTAPMPSSLFSQHFYASSPMFGAHHPLLPSASAPNLQHKIPVQMAPPNPPHFGAQLHQCAVEESLRTQNEFQPHPRYHPKQRRNAFVAIDDEQTQQQSPALCPETIEIGQPPSGAPTAAPIPAQPSTTTFAPNAEKAIADALLTSPQALVLSGLMPATMLENAQLWEHWLCGLATSLSGAQWQQFWRRYAALFGLQALPPHLRTFFQHSALWPNSPVQTQQTTHFPRDEGAIAEQLQQEEAWNARIRDLFYEPVIIANSPLKPADEEEHPALKEPAPNAGVKQTQDERVSTGRSQQRSASTQTNTEETEIKHHQQNGMRANDFGNRRKSTDQHSVREMRHSSSDRFSSSPASMHHYRRDRQYYEKPEHYSPLYDYSHKPYVPKPMHVEKLDTKYYYRLYLDRAMHDFRKLNSLVKQLDEDSSSKLNDECKRHADELRVLEKKKELDIREWSLKLREREVEERERYRSSSTSTPIPPTHSILKSASYSHPTAQWSSHQSQNGGSSGRVNFASPLYTAKEITPNTSMNISSGTVSGVAKTQAQPPIGQSQPFVARHQPCRHPLHRRSTSVTAKHKDKAPSEMPRVVLKNRANIGKYGVRPQSPLVRTPSPPRMSPSPRDPLADRENVMREIEQRAERERVRREAVCDPNRGNAPLPNKLAARPAPPSAKPTAYPGSMFSYISLPKNK